MGHHRTPGKWDLVDQQIIRAYKMAGGCMRDIAIGSRAFQVAVDTYVAEHRRLTGEPPDSTPAELQEEVLDTLRYPGPPAR